MSYVSANSCINVELCNQAVETLKTFEKKDSRVKSAAATNLSFLYFLVRMPGNATATLGCQKPLMASQLEKKLITVQSTLKFKMLICCKHIKVLFFANWAVLYRHDFGYTSHR